MEDFIYSVGFFALRTLGALFAAIAVIVFVWCIIWILEKFLDN